MTYKNIKMSLAKAIQTGNRFTFEGSDDICVFLYIQYNIRGECMLFYTKDDKPFSQKIESLFDLKRI